MSPQSGLPIPLVDKLILHELVGPVVNSIFLFLMLLFASAYLFKITDLLVQGVPFQTVALVTIYSFPPLITQTLPMAMLLGTLLAFGRLSGDSENIALYASGISFYRIARPVAFLGLLVSALAILWNETVVPPATRAYYDILQHATEHVQATTKPLSYDIKRDDGSLDETVNIDGGYDAKSQTLRRVGIVKWSDDPERRGQIDLIVYAQSAKMSDPSGKDAVLYDGLATSPNPDPKSRYKVDFRFQEARTSTLGKNVGFRRSFKGVMQSEVTDNHRMTFQQLRDKIRDERAQGNQNTAGDEVDLWEKVSLPLASLIFGLVGAPLGVRPQRGSKAMGFGIAILIIFCYWVVYHWMYVVGKSGGVIPPVLASFTADILGLIAAVILVARTRQ